MIRIVVDTLGGDRSPDAPIEGAVSALKKNDDIFIILTGDEQTIKDKLSALGYDGDRIEIVHAPEEITGEDKPTDAIRLKRNSSMMKAVSILRTDDTVKAMVSTGATGALVAASVLRIGRLSGIRRPAFCPILPTVDGGIVAISDSGATVDCTPEQLLEFAVMGSRYLSTVYGVENPRVALLNVGTESEKGDDLHKTAYALLENCKTVNFVGNMESRDFLSGKYDLVVADGFSGNVLVKSVEGTGLLLLKKLKKDIEKRTLYKLGALLMLKLFKSEKQFFDYQNYGGSVLLGTEKTVVKGHGSSKAYAVEKCIEQAYRMESGDLNAKIAEDLAKAQIYKENENV